ncbi:glutathione S-transferase [Meredithblackwellia eburnea MCA 4105]
MVKERQIGTPGPANKAIGGVPDFWYYDFFSRGRGEVIRLFFEEAGIAFIDHRWSFDERNKGMDDTERAKINPAGSVPYLELGGKVLAQSYPILRYLSAKLGEYDGKTLDEKYFVDVVCDLAIDWRTKFVDSAFVTDANGLNANDDANPFKRHKSYTLQRFVKAIDRTLAGSEYASAGPFVLGDRLTYADLVVFQIYHDEREIGGGLDQLDAEAPRVKKLVDAVANRPRIKEYFASDRYYN